MLARVARRFDGQESSMLVRVTSFSVLPGLQLRAAIPPALGTWAIKR
jgi:hypothetical protein